MSQESKRVFISGEWRPEPAEQFAGVAREVGKLLAESGYDLTCGPGSGISRYVLEGYESVAKEKRGKVIFYLPRQKDMLRVGEKMEHAPDVIVNTRADYPTRNIMQVRDADALIAITGGAGTVTEIICAVNDYPKPVAILDGSGSMVQAIRALPSIRDRVFFGKSAEELVGYIKEQLAGKGTNRPEPTGTSIVVSA